jgi:hypothetical protein
MKKKVGLLLPEEIVDALEIAAGNSVNGKQKWVAYSAAVLLFSMATPTVRSFFLRSVWGATIDDDFADLLSQMSLGHMERELQSYLASKGIAWSLGSDSPAADELRGVFPGKIISSDPSLMVPAAEAKPARVPLRRVRRRNKSTR